MLVKAPDLQISIWYVLASLDSAPDGLSPVLLTSDETNNRISGIGYFKKAVALLLFYSCQFVGSSDDLFTVQLYSIGYK